ncbi:hypothetical protein KQC08_00040, partial [Leptospira sp. Pond_2020]|nr:hypothetical protein [Leptospira sp. Pond_2020]
MSSFLFATLSHLLFSGIVERLTVLVEGEVVAVKSKFRAAVTRRLSIPHVSTNSASAPRDFLPLNHSQDHHKDGQKYAQAEVFHRDVLFKIF